MTSADVYRATTFPEPEPAPPRELVYEVVDRHKSRGMLVAWFQLFTLPVMLGIVVSAFVTPAIGLVAMIAGVVFSIWYRHRSARSEGAIFSVEEGEVRVFSRDYGEEKARLRLSELFDVRLEIKTIQRVQEGDSPIPAVRFTNSVVGPEIDTARIVLVGKRNGERINVQLTDAYLAHMDATEWLGKIRVFLRKHGWVPLDERKKKRAAAA